MSWGGFKKSINRAGTSILQKTGQVDRTVDSEFQEEVSRFKQMEKETLSLQKEAKAYLDAIRCGCCKAIKIVTITHSLSSYHQPYLQHKPGLQRQLMAFTVTLQKQPWQPMHTNEQPMNLTQRQLES